MLYYKLGMLSLDLFCQYGSVIAIGDDKTKIDKDTNILSRYRLKNS